jgi:hypothetical protein
MTKFKTTLVAAALIAIASSAFAATGSKPVQLAAADKATMSEPAADVTVKAKAKKHVKHRKARHAAKKAQ